MCFKPYDSIIDYYDQHSIVVTHSPIMITQVIKNILSIHFF